MARSSRPTLNYAATRRSRSSTPTARAITCCSTIHWVIDTRIPPLGATQNPETDPIGDRYTLLPDDTWPNYDDHSYAFAPASVIDATPEITDDDQLDLQVRLLYLINTQSYLDQLRDDNMVNDAGQAVWDMYDEDGGPQPMVLATASATVPLSGLELPDPGDGDGDGDPGDGDGDQVMATAIQVMATAPRAQTAPATRPAPPRTAAAAVVRPKNSSAGRGRPRCFSCSRWSDDGVAGTNYSGTIRNTRPFDVQMNTSPHALPPNPVTFENTGVSRICPSGSGSVAVVPSRPAHRRGPLQ